MAGGRQAWCPRCDELRAARPGGGCPVCGRQLLVVPPARPGQPQPRRRDRAVTRLRALLPAAYAAGAAVLIVAAVASAFAAGRLSRTTPSTPAASATTVPGPGDQGARVGRRSFNWQARASGLEVTLRSLTVGTGFTRLELHIDGVPSGREVSSLERLRVRDANGDDLLPGGEVASIPTVASRPASGGGVDTEVVLDQAIDRQAVAAVELGGLSVASYAEERLSGVLVDRELQRRPENTFDTLRWLASRRDCPGCRIQVTCDDCRSVRLTGSTYRRGRILLVVQALTDVQQTALNPSRRRVTVTDNAGISEVPAWIDGTGDTLVVSTSAEQLATHYRIGAADEPMGFLVVLQSQAERTVRGRWAIRQAGGGG